MATPETLTMEEMDKLQSSMPETLTMEDMQKLSQPSWAQTAPNQPPVPATPPAEPQFLPFSDIAQEYGHDPRLIHRMIKTESNWNEKAISPKGAMGLMQLMPGTAQDMGVRRPFDPNENVAGGSRYLRQLVDKYNGNYYHAIAAYNMGPNAFDNYLSGKRKDIPDETKDYLRKVTGIPWSQIRQGSKGSEIAPLVGSAAAVGVKAWKPAAVVAGLGAAGGELANQLGGQGIPMDPYGLSELPPPEQQPQVDWNQVAKTGLTYGGMEAAGRALPYIPDKLLGPAMRQRVGQSEASEALSPYVSQAFQEGTRFQTPQNLPGLSITQRVRSKFYDALEEIAEKSPFGGNRIGDYYQAQQIGGERKFKDMLQNLWSGFQRKLEPGEIGDAVLNAHNLAEDAFDDHIKGLYVGLDHTIYTKLNQMQPIEPGQSLPAFVDMRPLKNWASYLNRKLSRNNYIGVEDTARSEIEKVMNLPDTVTFEAAADLRTRIGKGALRDEASKPLAYGQKSNFYDVIDDMMGDAARNLGPDVYDKWREASGLYKVYKGQEGVFKNEFMKGLIENVRQNPSSITREVFSRENPADVEKLKRMLLDTRYAGSDGRKAWDAVENNFFEQTVSDATRAIQADPDKRLTMASGLENAYQKYGKETLNQLDPEKRTAFERNMQELRFQQRRDTNKSPSGRAVYWGMVATKAMATVGGGYAAFESDSPVEAGLAVTGTGALVISPRLAARFLTSKTAGKLFVDGVTRRLPPASPAYTALTGKIIAAAVKMERENRQPEMNLNAPIEE